MQSQFCEWCGAPAVDGSELCKNCLDAQSAADSESNQRDITPATTPATGQEKLVHTAGSIFFAATRAIGIVVVGLLMVGTMLFGTCSAIVAAAAISNPLTAAGFAVLSAIALGLTYLLYGGLTSMFRKPPREIDRIAKAGTEDV